MKRLQSRYWLVALMATLVFMAPSAQAEAWVPKAPMPDARSNAGVAEAGGLLYVVGGIDAGGNLLNTLQVYNPALNSWAVKAPMPAARQWMVFETINGLIYAAGGYPYTSALYVYDPSKNSWTSKAAMPVATQARGATVNGKLYVIGGTSSQGAALSTVQEYDPVTDSWQIKTPSPNAFYYHGATACNGKIYVMGGRDPLGVIDTVEVYDPALDSWTARASMPMGRRDFGLVTLNGLIYAFGGWKQSGSTAAVNVYNPATDVWGTCPSLQFERGSVAGRAVNNILYAIGGFDGATRFASVEAYKPLPADISLVKVGYPNPVTVGRDLSYLLVAVNQGPNPATGVTLTDVLPGGVSLVSAAASKGTWVNTDGTIVNSIGTLAKDASATLTVVVRPSAAGSITNNAMVTSNDDPDLVNNTASDVTVVNPAMSSSVQVKEASYTVGEGAGTIDISVVRSGSLASGMRVSYATSNGTAKAGLDYTAEVGMLTFNPGEDEKIISIPIINNSAYEADENFYFRIFDPTNEGMLGGQSLALLKIADDDLPGAFRFNSAAYAVSEDAGLAEITVLRSGGAAGGVSVNYATSNGTAIAGTDYTAVSGTLTFAAGETAKSFQVPVRDDGQLEPNRTIKLQLSNPTGGAAVITPAAAVLTLADNDSAGKIQFTSNIYKVNENAGEAVITVKRTGTAPGVSVRCATVVAKGNTAKAGVDYVAKTETLFFDAGETNKTFTVSISDDSVFKDDRNLTVVLSNPTGGAALGTPSSASLTIIDDDGAGTVQFAATSYAARESDGQAWISVTRTGGGAGGVTVDFAATGRTAIDAVDFVSTSGTLTFDVGETTKMFPVSILNNTIDAASLTVNLALSNPGGGLALGSRSTALLSIADDDVAGTLRFSAASYAVQEDGGSATITVRRSGGSASGISVAYLSGGGTASAGGDYTAVEGFFSFDAGETTKTFTVAIQDDTLDELNETLGLRLSNPTGRALLGTPSSSSLTILDNDAAGSVQFSASSYAVNEQDGTATITVTRANGAAGNVTVNYSANSGTAQAGVDYTPVSGTLTFAAGETEKTFTLSVADDTLDELNETVILRLSNPTGRATLGTRSTAVLTIVDDDAAGSVQFSAAEYRAGEDDGTVVVTVTRTGGASSGVSVAYATSNGTAVAGLNYTNNTGVLTFDAGETNKTFSVSLIDDAVFKGNRTVNLRLTKPTGRAVLGSPNTAVLTIVDNELGDGLNLLEGAKDYTGYFPPPDMVKYVEDGNLVDAWACPGQALVFFNTPITEASARQAIEANNGVVLAEVPAVGYYLVFTGIGQEATFISSILADERVNAALPHAVGYRGGSGVTVFEGCGDTHDKGVRSALLNNGGSLDALDACKDIYNASTNETHLHNIVVSILKDANENKNGTTLINLSTYGTSTYDNGVPLNGTNYEDKSDEMKARLQNAWYLFMRITLNAIAALPPESRKNLVITICSGNNNMPICDELAHLRKYPGMTDVLKNNVLVVSTTKMRGNYCLDDPDVAVRNNPEASKGTSFAAPGAMAVIQNIMRLTGVSASEALAAAKKAVAANSTHQLIQAEAIEMTWPAISITDVSAAEGYWGTRSFNFNVTLSKASSKTVTVNYATENGTATAGSDYQAIATKTLTFSAGQTNKTVAVTVNGDATYEPTENFRVKLTNPVNATIARSIGIGTILNDDSARFAADVGGGEMLGSVSGCSMSTQLSLGGPVHVELFFDGDSANPTAYVNGYVSSTGYGGISYYWEGTLTWNGTAFTGNLPREDNPARPTAAFTFTPNASGQYVASGTVPFTYYLYTDSCTGPLQTYNYSIDGLVLQEE